MATAASKKERIRTYTANVLWIGEVIQDLLVEDVKYYIEEIPAKFDQKVTVRS